jgi:hypothetical protein
MGGDGNNWRAYKIIAFFFRLHGTAVNNKNKFKAAGAVQVLTAIRGKTTLPNAARKKQETRLIGLLITGGGVISGQW